jgi:hypothetical protein
MRWTTVPSITEVCDALALAVDGISNLRAKGYIDDIVNPDEAQVYTREYDPRMVFSGSKRTFMLGVRVFVKRTDLRSADKRLRQFMEPSGSTSVTAKIEDEASWSGATVDFAEVTQISQPFDYAPVPDGPVYRCVDFDVDVCW